MRSNTIDLIRDIGNFKKYNEKFGANMIDRKTSTHHLSCS